MVEQFPPAWHFRPKPEWQDYNGHMGDYAFGIAFTEALDEFLFAVGFDREYFPRTGDAIFTLETHLTFLREIRTDEDLTIVTTLVDVDDKRIHVFQYLKNIDGAEMATYEAMLIHVRRSESSKAVPTAMPAEINQKLAGVLKQARRLPRPKQLGASIGFQRHNKRDS
ncbi:thioesterase family protein [Mesorhizobium denitrificans]|uniref:Thioesterase n=1 Tax=Mesorhizobium denitrificans TaxID=2294114 RepID=A0A371X6E6_9HYPH|nr:thioesterase family protein [Mesorhizobium denitrificans]RFC64808.1 hypothetical protein DY251_18790 [Mesorhizobium denitrificans]